MRAVSRRLTALACVVVLAAGSAGSAGGSARVRGGDMGADIRAVLADKSLANGVVGVSVAKLSEKGGGGGGGSGGEPEFVFRVNGERAMIPASNMKVLTTSAALATLGPDFRFRTQLLYRDGDLYLVGDGDPTFGDPEISRRHGWSFDTVFKQWVAELKRQGVTSVRHVYIDDSIFDSQFVHPRWPTDQLQYGYSAEVGGLSFYFNTVDLSVKAGKGRGTSVSSEPPTSYVKLINEVKLGEKNGVGGTRVGTTNEIIVRGEVKPGSQDGFEMTITDPGKYAGTVLYETFKREGIAMSGGVGRYNVIRAAFAAQPGAFRVMGVLETPIEVALARCNKNSANLYAESLAKRLAAKATGGPGSWEGFAVVLGSWLTKIGVPAGQFEVDDGSGLSRGNRISPDGMVRVLAYDFGTAYREKFIASMSVGGVDGTLNNRFGGELKGRVFAKSGTIRGVSTLSGYLKAKSGQWYAFSILLNDVSGVRAIHERIVRAVDENSR